METEKELLEYKIKKWTRKLAMAHTMLRKYQADLKRLQKREQKIAEAFDITVGRKFKFKPSPKPYNKE